MRTNFRDITIYFLLMVVVFLAISFVNAQNKPFNDLKTLTYDELIKDQDLYFGKTVRLKAIWTYGFEWTYLCDSDCKNIDKAWADVTEDDEYCRHSKKLRSSNQLSNKSDVVVIGKLYGGGGYGHTGMYRLTFVVSCIERNKRLPSSVK